MTGTGANAVSYDADGVLLTAPDCETLAAKVADTNLKDWRQLGPQVKELRVQSTHDGLIDQTGPQIIAVIKDVLRR